MKAYFSKPARTAVRKNTCSRARVRTQFMRGGTARERSCPREKSSAINEALRIVAMKKR